jgi:hypothetical protein
VPLAKVDTLQLQLQLQLSILKNSAWLGAVVGVEEGRSDAVLELLASVRKPAESPDDVMNGEGEGMTYEQGKCAC